MSTIKKAELIFRGLIGVSPAWLCILFFCVPSFAINVDRGNQGLTAHFEGAILLSAALAGVAAACALLIYVFFGKRLISPTIAVVFSAAGLVCSAWATVGFLGWCDLRAFAFVTADPLLCGLHLLYLGRSYFVAANATSGPTR